MARTIPTTADRFEGCLLGLAVGDALGGLFEAQSPDSIRARFSTVRRLIDHPDRPLWYTDDTQMAIGVAETLVEFGKIDEAGLRRAFVTNYVPSRGYGRGTRAVIEAMEEGADDQAVAEAYFPGGSYGNGAAMRVAPVGLFFRDDRDRLREQARWSALPTHRHHLGIEGAQLLALAVAIAAKAESLDRSNFFGELSEACESDAYRSKIELAARVDRPEGLEPLGNRIEAVDSVVTAIASFALTPESFEETIGHVILLGGDTDTIAAMAGALSGAYLGTAALPPRLLGLLEDGFQGRAYLSGLAKRLLSAAGSRAAHERQISNR